MLEFELHGQHVADIRPTVEKDLASCRPLAHTLKYVRFITGRGNHSGAGGPKLAPAVRSRKKSAEIFATVPTVFIQNIKLVVDTMRAEAPCGCV